VIKKILKKYNPKITGIIHVGANTGQNVNDYLDLRNINIYLFEPQKEAFRELSRFEKYPNIHLFNFGLGNTNKKLKLNKSSYKSGVSSSLLKPKLHSDYFPEYNFDDIETIQVRKFSSFGNIKANFLVLDVQGYELEVIKGFEEKLNKIDFVFTEISLVELFEGSALVKELDKFFTVNDFIRVKTSLIPNVPHGDALYLRKNTLNYFFIKYCQLKAAISLSKGFYYLNLFKDLKKLNYVIKKKIKFIIGI